MAVAEMVGIYVLALLSPLLVLDLSSDAALIPHRINNQDTSVSAPSPPGHSFFLKNAAN